MASPYLLAADNLVGLIAVLAVSASLTGIGGMLSGGSRLSENWLVVGFGAVSLVITVVGTATRIPFSYLHAAILTAGGIGLLLGVRRNPTAHIEIGRAVALASPLLLILAGASASQWDEFSNWLPKHHYLADFDGFPRQGWPASLSALPAYPYGLPTIGYLVARTAGFFVENAAALFNTILAINAGLLVARCAAEGAGRPPQGLSWRLIALGLIAATVANPAFVAKIVFTAYLDWTTAVVLAITAISLWRTAEALLADDRAAASSQALVAGFALAAFINLKQANLVLAALVVTGFAFVLLHESSQAASRALRLVPRLLLPAAITYTAWRLHVGTHIGAGEFSFLPFDRWLWASAVDIALRMALIASKKGGYFLLLLTLTAVAIRSLGRPTTPFRRLAILVTVVFLGYNVFLYVAYIGAFGEGEGRAAASYWRYNTQLGVVGVVAGAYGLGTLWRERASVAMKHVLSGAAAGAIAVALVVVAPVAQASRIRFDINPAKTYVRGVGAEIAARLPEGSRLAVIDRRDNGFWALLIRYELGRLAAVQSLSGVTVEEPGAIQSRLQGPLAADFVWVHVPEATIESALGVPLPARHSHLLARTTDGWQVLKSWPWPAYDDPHRFND